LAIFRNSYFRLGDNDSFSRNRAVGAAITWLLVRMLL